MIWVYNIALTLLAPFWVPWMLVRARRRQNPVNWRERSGTYEFALRPGSPRIWFHAVSVGEVMAALPILKAIKRLAPEAELVLSVTTSSGYQTAKDKAEGLYDHLVYFPIDVARFVLNALVKVRPDAVAIMETELWFNFLAMSKDMHATTLLVNGRISDRAFKRSKGLKFFYKPMLANLDKALMQSALDGERIAALGAANVEVVGNCKFDEAAQAADTDVAAWREKLGIAEGESVLVIGSTRGEMEEKFVLDALGAGAFEKYDRIVHAPRHLETAAQLGEAYRQKFGQVAFRSKGEGGKVLILDTYGELSHVYAVADVVVIGGGFDSLGGQNLIQPLAHGKPVLHGPNMHNFRDVTEAAGRAGATRVCATADELGAALVDLAPGNDDAGRSAMGERARALISESVGASETYATAIVEAMWTAWEANPRKQKLREKQAAETSSQ